MSSLYHKNQEGSFDSTLLYDDGRGRRSLGLCETWEELVSIVRVDAESSNEEVEPKWCLKLNDLLSPRFHTPSFLTR